MSLDLAETSKPLFRIDLFALRAGLLQHFLGAYVVFIPKPQVIQLATPYFHTNFATKMHIYIYTRSAIKMNHK